MTKDEALKLALEALERISDRFDLESVAQDATTAITAIKEALAQPEQDPVASLVEAIRAEPTELIHKWRVLELVKDYAPQPEQGPVAWAWRAFDPDDGHYGKWGIWKISDYKPPRQPSKWFQVVLLPYSTTPSQRKPDYKAFMEWASKEGYDTAYTVNSDTGKFIALSPMTADLWSAWRAAHGIKETKE